MVKISEKNIKLLQDDILSILYDQPLRPMFTNEIAKELRRDNEFTKKILLDLKEKGVVEVVKKSSKGYDYITHMKWRITPKFLNIFDERNQDKLS